MVIHIVISAYLFLLSVLIIFIIYSFSGFYFQLFTWLFWQGCASISDEKPEVLRVHS